MKRCPVCDGEGYTQDAGTGVIDYSGPIPPEYSECTACHGAGQVADDFVAGDAAKQATSEAAAFELLNSVKHIFFDEKGYGRI